MLTFNFFLFLILKILIFFVGIFFLLLSYRLLKLIKYQTLLRDVKIENNTNLNWPKVSLIVPVCNEGDTVENAAKSLFSMDYPNIEFIFVNDRSSDDTASILSRLEQQESRMKVLTISELPQGWLGKVNAFEQGRLASSGEWLLFSDADVHYHKTSLKKAMTYVQNQKLGFLAVLPSIVGGTFFVKVILAQIIHYLTLTVDFEKISKQNYPDAIAHGAFMLMNQETYKNSKGFKWLKMEVVDDVGLAVEMKRSGAKVGVLSGLDEIEFEWYSTAHALVRGFEKNTFAIIQYSLVLLGLMLSGMLIIFLGYTLFPVLLGNIFYMSFIWFSLVIYLGFTALSLRGIINISSWAVLLFPFTVPIFPCIAIRSAFKCLKQKGIYWRGTFYSLTDLKREQRLRVIKFSRNNH